MDAPAFPFPHRIDVRVRAREPRLTVDTTVTATGQAARAGRVRLASVPARARHAARPLARCACRRASIARSTRARSPTGASTHQPAEREPVGRRTFDDLYGLGHDRRFAFVGEDGRGIEMRCVDGYPFAQAWVPAGRTFGALEPMAAPTNALVEGTTPLVGPGGSFTARFSLTVT